MADSNLAKASHFILAASPIMNNKILADPEAYNKRELRSMFGTTSLPQAAFSRTFYTKSHLQRHSVEHPTLFYKMLDLFR